MSSSARDLIAESRGGRCLARRGRWLIAILPFLLLMLPAHPVSGIDIVLTYDDEGENPSFDTDGAKLRTIFNAAAQIWEDYLPESRTYHVEIEWDDDIEGLGLWTPDASNGGIEVNSTRLWWVDPTPLSHEEFNFQSTSNNFFLGQTLYRDLTGGQQDEWFDGPVPDVLEVGYRGLGLSNGPALDEYDLLSTALHELGHALGVNFELDDEFTIYPHHVGGASVVEVEADSLSGHIAPRSALMCDGCGVERVRRLPSAVDILVAAHDEEFTSVDLPRQDFLGNGSWDLGLNWIGGARPDGDDYAFVRNNTTAGLSSNVHIQGLVVAESGTIQTGPFQLAVDDDVTILGPSTTTLLVSSGGELQTTSLDVELGTLALADGVVNVSGPLNIKPGAVFFVSTMRGRGTVNLSGPMDNSGLIHVDLPGTLTINASLSGGGSVDLDGAAENGVVYLSAGDLTINSVSGLTDAYDGFMTIDAGNRVFSQGPWTLGATGRLQLLSESLQPSRIAGGSFAVRGEIEVGEGGFGQLQAPHTFHGTSEVSLGENGVLWLSGLTTFRGGSFVGNGTVAQHSNATVVENTQIDTARYDMDGLENAPATITVNNQRQFVVNSMRIDSTDSDGFDGTINLNGGTLDVQTHDLLFLNEVPIKRGIAWRMEGTLNLSPNGTSAPARVEGSRMTVGNPLNPLGQIGRINAADGWSRISAPVTFEESAQVVLTNNARLSLESTGPTIYRGGSFTGTGELEQTSDAHVEADTHLLVDHYDMDGANEDAVITVDRLVDFDIDTFQIEDSGGSNAFDGTVVLNGGRIIVRPHRFISIIGQPPQRQEFAWNMRGRLELNRDDWPATVAGNRMIIGEPDTSQPFASVHVGPGRTNITSEAVVFLPRSTLEIDLGGTEPNDFGRFHVITDLELDGHLSVSVVNGFIPTVGDSFIIASGLGSFSGTFDSMDFPGGEWELTYLPDSVVLQFLADTIDGDFDYDGDVDGQDFLAWQRGDSPDPLSPSDLNLWQTNYGNTSAVSISRVVPEPHTLGLLVASAAFVLTGFVRSTHAVQM